MTAISDTNQHTEYNHLRVLIISIVATIGGFLFGFDSGVINGTVDGLKTAFNSDSAGTGFNVASMLLGCAVGAFMAGRMADVYGRRTVLIAASIAFVISAWGSGISGTSGEFIIYRILGGFAVGAASVMAPAYISEIAPAHLRGRLTTIQQMAIIIGLFSSFLSNFFIANAAGLSTAILWWGFEAWRWMFWIELIPATIFFVALLFIPESPRYLVASHKTDQAENVLTSLFGAMNAKNKIKEIQASLSSDHQPSLADIKNRETGKVRPIIWIGIGLATFQQLVGINVVFYYGAVLWQAVGFSESDALLINIISGALSVGACAIALMIVDKVGRKPLLWIGSAGMAVSLMLVAIAFASSTVDANGDLSLSDQMGLLALISANVYVFFFNASWGPVMWVMLAEMFPNDVRGSGLAIAGLSQWTANFAITMTFPIMLVSIGLAAAYGIYAFFAAISVFFVLKYVHETCGVELEDMQG